MTILARHVPSLFTPARRRLLHHALLILVLLLPVACATNRNDATPADPGLFHDAAFPGSESVRVETREEVFHLDDEAKRYLDRNINSIRDYHERGRTLLDEIFHHAALNLSYTSNANTTASETFRLRTANCLSLSILAYAMAEYVGFRATFQEVDIPEYWERRSGFSLMNRHINLKITPKADVGTTVFRQVVLEVDFQPIAGLHNPPTRTISQLRTLAMFYNNKGVDALLAGHHETAYAYFKEALTADDTLDMAYTNLGLLYGVNGHRELAETAYRQAHTLNPGNAIAAEYLATLLRLAGRHGEAELIQMRLKRSRESNPYYFYILGAEAYDAGHWREAIHWFNKAVALHPQADEFHFGLARSHAQLGNTERAAAHLRRAERYAVHEDLKQKYRNKLSALSGL